MYDSKPRTTDGQIYESRKDSTKREWTLQSHSSHDETTNHRKYMRTQSSATNRVVSNSSSSQQQRQNGEKKAVKDTKKPLRIWTDWSEFQSSTGKTYFYNCKTEVSQWEKPKGWPKDDSSTHRASTTSIPSADRPKKESISQTSSTIRTRHKMDEVPSIDKKIASNSHHQNGTIQHRTHKESVPSNEPIINHTNPRLSSPGDDSSRMSFSSTSSKESSSFINHTNEINGITSHSSLSESVSTPISDIPIKPFETTFTPINGHTTRNSNIRTTNGLPQTVQLESQPAAISKIERDQEIQKFYRAELIQHLTDWPSTQLEKQCLKLFDDYYGYSAKISTAFTELKALKSNFRVVHIKRNVLTQKLIRCQKHAREREEDKPL